MDALAYSVRTRRPAAHTVTLDGLWAYYAAYPAEGRVFNAAMVAKAHGQAAGVLGACDFTGFATLADIGGGSGHLLRAMLAAMPAMTGVLFDVPAVIADAEPSASARLALQAGDFFQDALPVCDAYVLMEIVHDWPDTEALTILEAVRRAAPPQATLLVIEQIVPATPGPDWTKTLDILMLASLGVRQRTLQEYQTLLDRSGFRLARQLDTRAGISILEATPK